MSQSKRSTVEQMVTDAQARLGWSRAIARVNAGLPGKRTPAPLQVQASAGWAKVVAKVNGRIRAR